MVARTALACNFDEGRRPSMTVLLSCSPTTPVNLVKVDSRSTMTATATASATTSMIASVRWTPVASATAPEPSTSAVAQTSLTVTATATETKPTPSASVVDPVRPMPTAMASATTSMIASVRWTPVASATAQEPSTTCGCDDIPDGDCDCDGNQTDALGVCGGSCAADADSDGICDDVDDCVGDAGRLWRLQRPRSHLRVRLR